MSGRSAGRASTSGAGARPTPRPEGAGAPDTFAPSALPCRVALEFEVQAESWVDALVYLVATLEMPTGVRVVSTYVPDGS